DPNGQRLFNFDFTFPHLVDGLFFWVSTVKAKHCSTRNGGEDCDSASGVTGIDSSSSRGGDDSSGPSSADESSDSHAASCMYALKDSARSVGDMAWYPSNSCNRSARTNDSGSGSSPASENSRLKS